MQRLRASAPKSRTICRAKAINRNGDERRMPIRDELKNGFRIGDCEVIPARRVIRRGGDEISPEPKVWGVLMSLAARGGDVVTRDELIDEVWAGRPTGDEPINRCISQLRKHLGDTRPYRYIKPVTGSGYLLQEPVVTMRVPDDADKDTVAPPARRLWPVILAIAVVAVIATVVINQPPKPAGPILSIVIRLKTRAASPVINIWPPDFAMNLRRR